MHTRCWLRVASRPIRSLPTGMSFGHGRLPRDGSVQNNWRVSRQKIASRSIVWTRLASTTTTATSSKIHQSTITTPPSVTTSDSRHVRPSPLSRLSTVSLLRSLFLGYCFTSGRLLRILMGAMNIIVQSKSPFLSPDRNPILRGVIRALVYDHFCAGTTVSEVKKSITEIKAAGYAGVILGYGREIVVDASDASSAQPKGPIESDSPTHQDEHIAQWSEGNRATLAMIGANDYMNIK